MSVGAGVGAMASEPMDPRLSGRGYESAVELWLPVMAEFGGSWSSCSKMRYCVRVAMGCMVGSSRDLAAWTAEAEKWGARWRVEAAEGSLADFGVRMAPEGGVATIRMNLIQELELDEHEVDDFGVFEREVERGRTTFRELVGRGAGLRWVPLGEEAGWMASNSKDLLSRADNVARAWQERAELDAAVGPRAPKACLGRL